MRLVPFFAALACASPLFSAASGAATVIDTAGNVWRAGEASVLQPTADAFQKTGLATVCATENLSPFQPPSPLLCKHAFLVKQDPAGKVLYATWLGGSTQDGATALTTDAQGNVYVAGYTYSADFPVTTAVKHAGPVTPTVVTGTVGPFGPTYILAGGDAFVAKFSANGAMLYATLLGGSGSEVPSLIAVDSNGSVYVSGDTVSSDFPLTAGAMSRAPGKHFLTRLSANGSVLTYSTYSTPSILAFDVESQGRAYLTGESVSPNSGGANGPYLTVLDTVDGTVRFSTYLPTIAPKIGGAGVAVAVTALQELFLAVSPAPLPPSPLTTLPPVRPVGAAYLLKLPTDVSRVLAETDLGRVRFDSLQLDPSGNAYAFGQGSGALPTAAAPLLSLPCSPDGGVFVLQANGAGSIVAATYLRQSDDTAVTVASTGRVLQYRARTSTTAMVDLATPPAANFGCPDNLAADTGLTGIAPGEIFVIRGTGLGPAQGVAAAPDATGQYPVSLAGVQVLFNSKAAPLLFVQDKEIHAVAPFGLADFPVIQVQNGAQSAPPLDVSRTTVNPAIFSLNGQGAIVNQDGAVNTPSNPARLGSAVSFYATGTGTLMDAARATRNPLPDGQVTPTPPPFVITELAYPQLILSGVPGTTLWSGSAPGSIAGVTQINVQLPDTLPALGQVPVVLNAAGALSPPVMISVKQ